MQYVKNLILIGLHMTPVLFAWWARGLFDAGSSVVPAALMALACLCVAATLFRGLYLEERIEDIEPFEVTPLWPKRLPRWARDTLPPTNPPPLRTMKQEPFDEPSRTRLRRVEWPDGGAEGVPSSPGVSTDMQAEITKTEPRAS